ncbi:30S ribosomal protein S18 [Treponema sp. R6D11]
MENNKERRQNRRRGKPCYFCKNKEETIDYKDVFRVKKFVTDRFKILPRRMSGSCAKHQRAIATAVKRARHLALIPFTTD